MQVAHASAAAVQAQSTAESLAQSVLYSASVAGRTYTADIGLNSGQYVATIPGLPGVMASGNSRLIAEHNLNTRIDLMA